MRLPTESLRGCGSISFLMTWLHQRLRPARCISRVMERLGVRSYTFEILSPQSRLSWPHHATWSITRLSTSDGTTRIIAFERLLTLLLKLYRVAASSTLRAEAPICAAIA